MNGVNRKLIENRWRFKALSYALIYMVLAGLWILLSGKALGLFVELTGLTEIRADLEIYKGWMFVLLTGLALYALLHSWHTQSPNLELDTPEEKALSKASPIKLPVIYLLGLLLIAASGGYVVFEHLKRSELQRVEQNLSAVANLKAAQINGWLVQSSNFAAAAGNGSYLASNFEMWTRHGKLPESRAQWLRKRLASLRQSYPNGDLTLYDVNGKPYLGTGKTQYDVMDHVPTLVKQVMTSKRPELGAMHWHDEYKDSRYVSLPMAAPLLPEGVDGPVVGIMSFELNPQKNLFPLIESWPTPSPSAETLLVQRDGEEVIFLNKPRYKEGSSLSRMNIAANPTLLAVQAVKRTSAGPLSGVDYRGVKVIGHAERIQNTDWWIIAKVDASEIDEPIQQIAINVALTAFILAFVGSLSLYFWWRHRRGQYESAQMAARLQQQVLENQVDFLSKFANDIILLLDEDGNIVDANDRAEISYQRPRDELIGLNIREFRSGDELGALKEQWQKMRQHGSIVFEATHLRRDGSTFPVEVSSRLIENERGIMVQSIVRDISERKLAEHALRTSEAQLASLFNNMTNGFALHEVVRNEAGKVVDYRFIQVNPAYEKMTGLRRTQVIGKLVTEVLPSVETYWIENYGEVATSGKPRYLENYAGGIGRWFSVYAYSPAAEQFAAVVQDITERKQVEWREIRLKNTLRVLSEMNGAIVRLEDVDALFPLACRIAVDFGGMALAWVGLPDLREEFLVPIASYGTAGYLDGIQIALSPDVMEGKGPSAIAYRDAHAVVVNDFSADAIASPWLERAQQFSICASACFPIMRAGKSYAVFTVYSSQPNSFDKEIVGLLEEVAANLSFALDNFDRDNSRKLAEQSLRQSEERFRRVANEAPFPSILYAEDGEVQLVNRVWTDITGYTLADIPSITDWTAKAYGESAPQMQAVIKDIYRIQHREDSGEFTIRCHDGSQRVWHFISSPMGQLPDGRRQIFSMAVDVTERKKADEDLRMAATVFESSHSSIMITDSHVNIIAVNPAFTAITGYSEQEVVGKNPSFLQSGRQGADFYRDFWRDLSQDGHWQGEMWNRRKNGDEYAMWLSISAMRDQDGQLTQYIGISDDITEAKESQSRIEYLAYHDALTGLPNRTLANDRLLQSIAHAHRLKNRVAVMFLDLDDFKTINDTLGHSTGDLMLKAVADRLLECVRVSDTVSRQGGDEFLVMLNDVTDVDAINNVAVGILERINRPYLIEEHELSTSTSIGIAIYPDDGQDCDTLLKNADMAMYNAKQSGRNTHRFFAEEMNDYVLEHLLIRNGLMRALENSEFQLHYQPQLALASGKLIGAEALIRWLHPELGMVPPNRFIHVAEESGMIVPIGEWVLREACKQAVEWQKWGWPEMVVSVNISAVQFRRGDLEQVVSTALAESGLGSQFLELELTESILIQDVEKSLDIIRRLKELGVRLSIDDFGTGYSSLAYLRQLPVDKLKIDQSFVREITARQDDAAIALSIITLAHTLQKRVIAEGVETKEQLRFLQQHGCDELQGYLFSRPLAPDLFAEFLNNGASLDILHQD